MKVYTIPAVFIFCLVMIACTGKMNPQQTTEESAAIAKLIQQKEFVFKAQNAIPMGGQVRQLIPPQDLVISNDSIISFLPYFGRSFTAPIDPTRIGIEFVSTNFNYETSLRKKGGWDIIIQPTDYPAIQSMRLNITPSGYAYANITFTNRQPIRFNGVILTRETR